VISVFLQDFSKSLAPNAHAVLVLDKAGWHTARRRVPENISLVLLPAYSPELNPVERVWLYLREQSLSHRVWDTVEAIFEACCTAWNDLVAEEGRLASLNGYPYLEQVRIS
jgi:transposase